SPQHRLRVPRLQAPPEQDGLRERRVRDGGHRPTAPRRAGAGSTGARPRRSREEGRAVPVGAVGRRAAACVHRARLREPSPDPARRRAHWEPRPGDDSRHHADPRSHQPHRHHRGHGHARSEHRRRDAPARHRTRPGQSRSRPIARRVRRRRLIDSMWTRIVYFARETLVSLRRNVLMTIAGIATVAVSLSLFGGILMLSKWVDHGTEVIKGGVTLDIFMTVKATDQQIKAVETQLNQDKGPKGNVKSYRQLTNADAY